MCIEVDGEASRSTKDSKREKDSKTGTGEKETRKSWSSFKKQNWSTGTEIVGKKWTQLMKSYIQKEYQATSGKQNT